MSTPDELAEELASIQAERGWRLYLLLALFDTRDCTPLADMVRSAREGYERSAPTMNEADAWAEFDRHWNARSSQERLNLVRAHTA